MNIVSVFVGESLYAAVTQTAEESKESSHM